MARSSDFTLTDEEAVFYRKQLKLARPYTEDDPEPDWFDWIEDRDRSNATRAVRLLKAAGLWTAEDEKVAFGPHPPRPQEKD